MAGPADATDATGDAPDASMAGVWTALVLAAGRPDHPIAIQEGVSNKHLADVHGRSILQRCLDALAAAPSVGRVVVAIEDTSGLDGLDPKPEVARAAVDLIDTVDSALGQLGPPLLVVVADHALMSADMIEGFLATTVAEAAGVAFALTTAPGPDSVLGANKPGVLPLADGDYCVGGLVAFASAEARPAIELWRKHSALRDDPKALIRALDPWALGLIAVGRLTLKRAMERLSRRVGLKTHAVVAPMPEAALSVEKPEDLALVRRLLAARTIGA